MTIPPTWCLIATVLGTVAAAVIRTVIPARLGTRHRVTEVVQAEFA